MELREPLPADAPRGRTPRALVVEPEPDEAGAPIDWSGWVLTDEEDMGQGCEQGSVVDVVESSLSQLARERGWQRVHVGVDNFFAWVASQPLVRVSPDVYLLDEPPSPPLPASWQTWLPGHRPPRFAVEVVSEEWKKDYEINPAKYAQLGAGELVIFDVDAATGATANRDRVPLQVYRRDQDGAFVRTHRGLGPARCDAIDAWVVVAHDGPVARLRLARDAGGHDVVKTAAEALVASESERARAEAERARAEAERDLERTARQAAERELAELVARLGSRT